MNNNKRLRILYFERSGGGTGSIQSLKAILSLLDRTRFEPILWFGDYGCRNRFPEEQVIELRTSGLINCDFFPASIRLIYLKHLAASIVRVIMDLWRVPRILKELNPDLVHINCGTSLSVGIIASRMGFPVVWHIREAVCKNGIGRLQDWVYSTFADKIIMISDFVVGRLPVSVSTGKVARMYNAVGRLLAASESDVYELRSKCYIKEGQLVVLLLGTPSLAKGYVFLSQVAELTVSKNIKYILAGDLDRAPKSERLKIKTAWEPMIKGEYACFPGVLPSVTAISACDIVVCPNQIPEPLGRTVLESGRLQTAVIATDCAAFDETVIDGETGWLLASEPLVWADKLMEIEADRGMLQTIRENITRYSFRFDDEAYISELENIYEFCCKENSVVLGE